MAVRERVFAVLFDRSGGGEQIVLGAARRQDRPSSSRGFPSVSVPVLSTTTVVTFPISSIASALRMSIPACAPRPTPTMIDIGVARPSAHGQAMMSTATALTSA